MVVGRYMTPKVITVRPDTNLQRAWHLIQTHHIRHLPVTQGGRLVGIISDRHLRHMLPSSLAPPKERKQFRAWGALVRIDEVMTREVITVTPETPTYTAARLMVDRRIECIPVLRGSALVGILTTADLLRALATKELLKGISSGKRPSPRRKSSGSRGALRTPVRVRRR